VWLESIKPSSGGKTVPPDYEPRAVGATVARMRMINPAEMARMTKDVRQATAGVESIDKKLEGLREKIVVEPKEIIARKRAKQKPRKKSK